jgi:transposase InsO family protein
MAEFAKVIENDYGIKRKVTTVRNPQANAILERVHQTIGKIIRTFQKDNLDKNDPWGGVLQFYPSTAGVWMRLHIKYKILSQLGFHKTTQTRNHKEK